MHIVIEYCCKSQKQGNGADEREFEEVMERAFANVRKRKRENKKEELLKLLNDENMQAGDIMEADLLRESIRVQRAKDNGRRI